MEHPKEIVDYFNCRGVSVIFLFRRNLLRRMVSTLANSYDRYAKLLNGTHKSHVHSTEEVFFPITLSFNFFSFIPSESSASCGCAVCVSVVNFGFFQADTLSRYKPTINSTSLLADLKDMEKRAAAALEYFNTTRHMILYYEDLIRNRTVRASS